MVAFPPPMISETKLMIARAGNLPGKPGPHAAPLLDPSDRAFWIGLVIVVLSLFSATATYAILTGLTRIAPSGDVVIATLFVNVVLIIAMIATIAWQATGLIQAWRDKVPGARLHVRIVALFSVIAALPAILLALAATTTFSRSLDGWFSSKTREIINNSGDVARAYLDVHGQLINTDILNMARDLDAAAEQGALEPEPLQKLLLAQVTLRGLLVGYVIDADGRVVASAFDNEQVPFQRPPKDAILKAEAGQVPLMDSSSSARVYAVAKLNQMAGRYLYVAREVSPAVVGQIRRTEQNTSDYYKLRGAGKNLKIAHGLMYFMISVTSLLAAIWAGLWFAARFVAPIRRLIEAAQEVSRGNLAVALPEKRGEGDLRRLSSTFNTMTRELKTQRDALVAVNGQLNERGSFMEAVLSGVSAGVIGLDADGTITLVSRSAETLLGRTSAELVGRKLATAIPEFAELATGGSEPQAKHKSSDPISMMIGPNERTFAAQVTREKAKKGDVGSVVTFDDITELVVAQRTSAWADVARRIAHEIKNPLTPIQLSAERIKRKYGAQITTDKETFDKLTDTISRQVGDIKSMVDEFASFARMPQPQMENGDLREVVHEPVVLFRESHPLITFELDMPAMTVPGFADRRLLTQAITNLVKNATEGIDALVQSPDRPENYRGRIEVRLTRAYDRAVIEVIDNGVGLPKQNRAKLLEPYVTTRAKGTGLGLAIVQKIVEQHRGTLVLDDAPEAADRKRGARVMVTLPMPAAEAWRDASGEAATTAATPEAAAAVAAETGAAATGAARTVAAGATAAIAPAGSDPPPGGEPPAAHVETSQSIPLSTPPSAAPKKSPNPVPSVSPTLSKNSSRVMPSPPGRNQGAR
jgi:two-component system, NtrC family, nitrogen regulation sensor histidine kinase NtrY